MDKKVFKKIREIVYEKSGINLGDNKESLVSARIAKRIRHLKLQDDKAYLDFVLNDQTGDEYIQLIDVISTNVTSFFREEAHFDFVKDVFTKWQKEGQRRFRFWCAASSTGEEPYSLAITLLESMIEPNLDLRILATDISTRVLKTCMEGQYKKDKLKTVSMNLLTEYFDRYKEDKETFYKAKQRLKKIILFRRLNLSTPPFPMKGPMDFVFCRNVMIYFDNTVRRKLLMEIYRLLKPGGYLFVGHAESLTGMIIDGIKTVRPSIYQKL